MSGQRIYEELIDECGEQCPAFIEDCFGVAVHGCELHEDEMPALLLRDLYRRGVKFPECCPLREYQEE